MSATQLFESATSSRAAGDLQAAASGYAAAIRLRPDMAEAYLNAGWVLSELGQAEGAAAAYNHGLRLREWPPDTAAAARSNLGVLLRDLGRPEEAKQQFLLSLEAKPDFKPALGNLDAAAAASGHGFGAAINEANELFGRGANDEAAEVYRKALSMRDPRVDGSAYVGLGAALHGARRLREAAEVLSAGAKLNPSSPGMLQNLATVRTDLGHWKGAASAWRKVLAMRPDDPDAHRAAFGATKNAKGARAALPLLARAARLDPLNWHHHYSAAHGYLHEAYYADAISSSDGIPSASSPPDAKLAASALHTLRPLHRLPISMGMRSEDGAVPPWTRDLGRGLLGDEPPPMNLDAIWRAQAGRRAEAAAAGRQRGLIVYKLGPKASEVEHLKLSLRLLMRHHNRAFRYPILLAHDEPIDDALKEELMRLAAGVSLRFAKLHVDLPSHLDPQSVPERVLGFPVAYRHMIRWKVGLLWHMPEVAEYEYIWSLDTDAFILGPLTYDVFGLMAARNATYGFASPPLALLTPPPQARSRANRPRERCALADTLM